MRGELVKHLIFAFAMILAAGLMLDRIEEKSPTEDEWAHLVRGLQYWHGDDHRLQYAHPPLANALTALPFVLDDEGPDFSTLDGWDSATVGRVAYAYLERDYDHARRSLMTARRASVAVAMAGLVYAYLWGISVLGSRDGLVLALLLAFNPALLGQARYVSSDIACAVACFIVVGELARHLRARARGPTWVGVPVALSLAVLSKHSALLVVPFAGGLTFAYAALGRGPYADRDVGSRLRLWGMQALLSAAIVMLALNLAYGFQETGMTVSEILAHPEPQYWISTPHRDTMLERFSLLGRVPATVRVPLPYPWLFGVSAVRLQSAQGYPWSSFFGVPNPRGHIAFFPVLILLKTPLVWLAGGAGSLVEAWRRRGMPPAVAVMAGASAVFLAMAMTSNLNMGVRHVLPVVILAGVPVAFGLCSLWDRVPARSRWALMALAPVLLCGPAVAHRDDYLGYFNVGRELGHRVSVVGEDVGQDRLRFAHWVDEQGIGPLYYDTQTKTRRLEARWVGLDFIELDCGTRISPGAYVAVHASRRIAMGRGCFPQLKGLEPIATFNQHIDVYRIPLRTREKPTRADRMVLSAPGSANIRKNWKAGSIAIPYTRLHEAQTALQRRFAACSARSHPPS